MESIGDPRPAGPVVCLHRMRMYENPAMKTTQFKELSAGGMTARGASGVRLLLAAVVLAAAGLPACAESEPNDVLGDADPLAANGSVGGVIDPGSERDWFRVDIPGTGRWRLSLVNPPSNMRGQIVIYDRHAVWTGASAGAINDGDDVFLTYDFAQAGTWFVSIGNLNNQVSAGGYSLASSFTAAVDANEPSARIGEARLVTASPVQGCLFPGTEEDWYRIYVAAGGTLSLTLTAPTGMLGELAIFGRNLEWAGVYNTAANPGDTVHLNYAVPAAGMYSIRVKDADLHGQLGTYSLAVSGGTPGYQPPEPQVTVEVESNDALHASNMIGLGTSVAGAIGVANDGDWFTFVPTQAGQVTFALTQAPAGVQLRMRLFNADGAQILGGQAGVPGGLFPMTYEVTKPERYYLLVDALAGGFSASAYQFSATMVAVSDPFEPNNDYGDATPLSAVNQVQGYIFGGGDQDWFRVHVSAPGELSAIASLLPPNLAPRLQIFDMSRNLLAARSGNAGADLEIVYPIARAGDYLIVVTATGGADLATQPYTLSVFGADFTNFAPVASIDLIDPGAIVVGDRVDFSGSGTDVDGTVVGYEWRSSIDGLLGTAAAFSTTTLSVGTHTITFRVRDDQGIWSTHKSEILYVGSSVSEEAEPNGSFHPANEVALNRPLTGRIGAAGDEDFFKIYVPGPARVVAEASNVPANLRLDLAWFGPHWEWLGIYGTAASAGDDTGVGIEIPAAGFYYLRVRDYAGQAEPVFVYTLRFAHTAVPDPHEPNDEIHRATLLTTTSADAFVFPGNQEDWYKIWVAAGSTLVAGLDPVPGDVRMEVAVFGRNREWLGVYDTAANPGEVVSAQLAVTAGGYYFIRVKSADGGRSWTQTYRLNVSGGNPGYVPPFIPTTAEQEDNDVIADGNPVALGTSMRATIAQPGDPDWFAFDMPTPGTIHLAIDPVPATLRPSLRLWRDNAALIDSRLATNAGDALAMDVRVTEAGRYHVSVEGAGGSSAAGDYVLSLSATAVVDPHEPNDTFQDAVPLAGLNRVQPYLFATGDADWFRVAVPAGATLRVTIGDVPADLQPQIEIYDHDAARLASKRASNRGQGISLSWPVATAGDYTIRVSDVGGGCATDPYTLVIDGATFTSYVPVAVIDSITPNPADTGVPITFTGHGEDQDGSISGYRWRSSIDGVFSISQVAAGVTSLTNGMHEVFLSVRDNSLNWSPETAAVLFVGPTPAEQEPNGVAGSATLLDHGRPCTGEMNGSSDYDWYRIHLDGPGRLTIQASNPPGSAMRTDLGMFTPDLEWAGVYSTASNDGDPVTLTWDLGAGGDYFLRLRDAAGRAGGRYTVTASVKYVPDPFEPNPDPDRAAVIAPDDELDAFLFTGPDQDWYRVTVDTPGRLAMALTNVPANLRLRVDVFGQNREWTGSYSTANNPGDNVFLNYDIAAAGTWFLRVDDVSDVANADAPYHFTTTFTPAPDMHEPNNSPGTAPEMTASPVFGYLFPAGDNDFYRIYAGTGSALSITADQVPANLRLQLWLYDRNGSWMGVYQQAAAKGAAVTLNYGPASGWYYVRVFDTDGDRAPGQPYRLAVSGAALGAGPNPPPGTAETEPNNDRGAATPIGTAAVTGTLADYDWFRIDLDAPSEITARVVVPATQRVAVRLYNADGGEIAVRIAENKGDINELVFPVGTAGSYFLWLRDEDGAASTAPYTLTVSLAPADDPHEPNGSYADAAPLAFGSPTQGWIFTTGDVDFYQINPPGAGVVRLTVTGVPATIEARVQVVDNNNAVVATKENLNAGDPFEMSFEAPAAGSYGVLVHDRGNNGYGVTPYTLTAEFIPAVDANEPNGLFRDATLLAARNQAAGMIHPTGDTDWYRLVVAQPGTLRVQLAEGEGINPELRLYDDSRAELAVKSGKNPGDAIELVYSVTVADTYYLLVRDSGNNHSSSSPYLLTIAGGQFAEHFPLANLNPVFEPNPAAPGAPVTLSGGGSDEDDPVVGYEWTSDRDGLLGSSATIQAGGLSAGVHRIGLRVRDAAGHWSARIYQHQIVADPILAETEYNNDIAHGQPLPLNTWLTGAITSAGDLDYYKIYLDRCGTLRLQLDSVPATMKADVQLFGPAGESLGWYDSGWNNGEWLDFAKGFAAGWYHVRVQNPNYRAEPGTYALRCGFTPAGDRYEPNAEFATATRVDVNAALADPTICPAGDQDFYRVDFTEPGRLVMRLTGVPAAMRGEIALFDQNLAWMGRYTTAYHGGEQVTLVYDADEAQTLYLRVQDVAGLSHTAPYTLDLDFTPVPDSHEPNDWGGDATLLTTSTVTGYSFAPGDEDWFRVFVDSGQTLTMALTGTPATMVGEIAVFGRSLEWLGVYQTANSAGDEVYLSYAVPQAGMYSIRIKDNSSLGQLQPYQLSVSGGQLGVEPPFAPSAGESEANNIWGDADDINLDTDVTGTVNPADDFDYFRIWLNAPGVLTVAHTNIPAGVTSEMWVHDRGFTQLGYRRTTNPGEDNILELAAPTAGYHYIRVRDYGTNNASTSPYRLRVSHLPVVDPHEPNDVWGRATPLGQATVNAYLFPGSDQDHYRVFMREPGVLSLSLDAVPATNRPRLAIFDENGGSHGSYVNTNPGVGGSDLLTYAVPARGFYTIRVNDQDGHYAAQPYTLRVGGGDFSLAPDLDPIGNRTIEETITYQFAIRAVDPDNPQDLQYSAANLPPGATFDPLTRLFRWTPARGQAGVYPGVHFEVSDGTFTDSEDITITVERLGHPPVLEPIGDRSLLPGFLHTFQVSGSDPDAGDTLTYAAHSLPSGATFDPLTRTFRWTPTKQQAGVHANILFEVTDGTWTDFEYVDLTVTQVTKTYQEWQAVHFTPGELAIPAISGDAADPDEDGVPNLDEYYADTNPRDGRSFLHITAIECLPGGIRVAWSGGVNAAQFLEFAPAPDGTAWTTVFTNNAPTAIDAATTVPQPSEQRGFYRIRVERR